MKDDLLQEYNQFKIVADIKCKQVKTEHERYMINWRLEQLKHRFENYSHLDYDIEKVRKIEKKYINLLQNLNANLSNSPTNTTVKL